MSLYSYEIINRFRKHFEIMYPDCVEMCVARLSMTLGRYNVCPTCPPYQWNEKDIVLITYGDTLRRQGEHPLVTLRNFLAGNLLSCINSVHVLPFFPYSSDDGFSVTNFRRVNPACGTWNDIEKLAVNFRLMVDLVLNHVSRDSAWFRDFVNGVMPASDYFITVDPETDLSSVTRPRATPLLTKVDTHHGEQHVWTTFSADQIDLNFANPDVLFEFLDILLLYLSKGARIIRLDAIAYAWKKIGTSCVHLPECHHLVKFLRDFLDITAPDAVLLTETNVPHEENISYFGDGDEARMVYQFSLPPLLLHSFHSSSSALLSNWASSLSEIPPGCTYFNFTASHDGIGVRPLEGLLDSGEVAGLVEKIRQRGGKVSLKANPDGSESPYELNCTYLDALADPETDLSDKSIKRFLSSQAIMLAMNGVPAVYFHSLVGTRNYQEGIRRYGFARAINRRKWEADALEKRLADETSHHARIFGEYRHMLRIRSSHPSFHPDGPVKVHDLGENVFAMQRTAPDDSESILSLTNLSNKAVKIDLKETGFASGACKDVLSGDESLKGKITIPPCDTLWLKE